MQAKIHFSVRVLRGVYRTLAAHQGFFAQHYRIGVQSAIEGSPRRRRVYKSRLLENDCRDFERDSVRVERIRPEPVRRFGDQTAARLRKRRAVTADFTLPSRSLCYCWYAIRPRPDPQPHGAVVSWYGASIVPRTERPFLQPCFWSLGTFSANRDQLSTPSATEAWTKTLTSNRQSTRIAAGRRR